MKESIVMPKLSVCIPTYNCASYLPQAIESVLQQEFTDLELVIADDASTDETPELCRSMSDPRIRYIRYEENAGQAGNFNRCFKEAKGELLTLLSADDFFLPGLLKERVARLDRHPRAGFAVGALQVIDAGGAVVSSASQWPGDRFFDRGEFLEPLLFGAVVNTLSLVFRRECLDQTGLFNTDLTWGHDWEWILRLAAHHAGFYVSKPLAAYRVHDASGTAEQLNAAKNGYQERRILQDTFASLSEANKRFRKLRRPAFQALSRRHMYFAEQALFSGRKRVARNNLWYAMLADNRMLARPTFYALLAGSIGLVKWYTRYKTLRNAVTFSKAES